MKKEEQKEKEVKKKAYLFSAQYWNRQLFSSSYQPCCYWNNFIEMMYARPEFFLDIREGRDRKGGCAKVNTFTVSRTHPTAHMDLSPPLEKRSIRLQDMCHIFTLHQGMSGKS